MDASSSPSANCSCKRKRTAPHEKNKRLKTEHVGDGGLRYACAPDRPSVSVLPDRLQQPITLKELTELLHFAALGKSRGIKQPSWCHLHHQQKVHRINVAIMEGLTQSHFNKHYFTLQQLRTNYNTRVTFTPSSEDIASGIFTSEVPKRDWSPINFPRSPLQDFVNAHPVVREFGKQKRGLTAYVLSTEEMIRRHYPVKGIIGFEEFVCTDTPASLTDHSPLFSIDCEMCLTSEGHELTHVSLVDSSGTCLMDELVKPRNKIINYLTSFSGITEAMLHPVTTTLQDVQARLRKLLPSNAVLVNHSIDCDLKALQLIHPHVIDTSLLYKRENDQKFKLKVLAEAVLKRQIQASGQRGHQRLEDALAALELAQYFIQTGPAKVVELHMEDLWSHSLVDQEVPDCEPDPSPTYRFSHTLERLGRSVAYSGKRPYIKLDVSHQQWHSSDKELLASLKRQSDHPFLSVAQFSSFSEQEKRQDESDEDLILILTKLDDHLGKVFQSLPDGTLSVVLLPGRHSESSLLPGLCFMEVKQDSQEKRP